MPNNLTIDRTSNGISSIPDEFGPWFADQLGITDKIDHIAEQLGSSIETYLKHKLQIPFVGRVLKPNGQVVLYEIRSEQTNSISMKFIEGNLSFTGELLNLWLVKSREHIVAMKNILAKVDKDFTLESIPNMSREELFSVFINVPLPSAQLWLSELQNYISTNNIPEHRMFSLFLDSINCELIGLNYDLLYGIRLFIYNPEFFSGTDDQLLKNILGEFTEENRSKLVDSLSAIFLKLSIIQIKRVFTTTVFVNRLENLVQKLDIFIQPKEV